MMDPDADLSDPVFIHILYLQVKVLVIYFLSFFRQMIQNTSQQKRYSGLCDRLKEN